MAQVKDFVSKVLAEINAVLERRGETGMKNFDILLRCESGLSRQNLQIKLQEHETDNALVSPASLQFLVDFLYGRFALIKNTDGVYNHHPESLANVFCVILAKHLSQALVQDGKTRHYFEYLYPNLRCADYVTSKGDLGALELHEFFLGDTGIPIEVLPCLERYREMIAKGKQCYPPHVCLPEGLVGANKQLTIAETNRLISHSNEAHQYYKAISSVPMKSADEMDFFKNKLHALVNAENFLPHYTYNDHRTVEKSKAVSNVNLLNNAFLSRVGVNDLQSFAKLLTTVDPAQWIEFVDAVDDVFLDQVVLPKSVEKQPAGTLLLKKVISPPSGTADVNKQYQQIILQRPDKTQIKLSLKDNLSRPSGKVYVTPDGREVWWGPDKKDISLLKPNVSMLESEKFGAFVDSPVYEKDNASVLNRAILFLITWRYLRKKAFEGDYNGVLGGLVGIIKAKKETAAVMFLEFLTDMNYQINQPDTYFEDKDGSVNLEACKRDRLGYIYRKALALGPNLGESAESISRFAELLSDKSGDKWLGTIRDKQLANLDHLLQKYVDSSGGLLKCIKSQKYIDGRDSYNRGILFLLTDFYIRDRQKKPEITGNGGYGKDKKVPAAIALREFFCSDHRLDDLEGYLHQTGQAEFLPVIRDMTNKVASMLWVTEPSILSTLAAQAEIICKRQLKPQHHQEQPHKKHGWFS